MATRTSHYPLPQQSFITRLVLWSLGLGLFGFIDPAFAQPTATPDKEKEIAAINAEMNDAVEKVKVIINQRVGALKRVPGMKVTKFTEGWFHQGATKPNFNAVDVRTTQDTAHYAKETYVTSDLNPGYVFLGSQLEFNSMTKYFYTDYSLPKKKLTEAEMLEINRLYRIIGACEKKLLRLNPRPEIAEAETMETETNEPARKYEPVPKGNYVKAAIGVSLVLIVYFAYRKFR